MPLPTIAALNATGATVNVNTLASGRQAAADSAAFALSAEDFAAIDGMEAALAAILAKLPTAGATETKQDTANALLTTQSGYLDNLETLITATNAALATLGTQTTAAAILAKLSSDPATQTTLAAVLAKLSADPATQTTLAAMSAKLPALLGQTTMAGSVSVTFASNQSTLPVSIASLPALAAGSAAIGSITNTAFGISGTLPAFAATPTFNLGTAPTLTVTGPATDAQLRATPLPVSLPGVASASAAAPTFAAGPNPLSVDLSGNLRVVSSGGGTTITYNVTAPTLTNGQTAPLQADTNGNLKVAIVSGGVGNNLSVGATGAAVPAQATYLGMLVGGVMTGMTGTANGLKVDGSAVTQPVSGTVALDAPTLAALENITVNGTVALDAPTLAALENTTVSGTVEIGAASLAALETTELGAATLAALENITVTGPLTDAQLRAVPVPMVDAVTVQFRDAFEILDPTRWTIVVGTGDIVQVDGNTAAASYLEISKSPWNAGNETTLETIAPLSIPAEVSFGAHRSQATLGQEFSFELVSTDAPLADIPDLAITSITQTTTVLTIDFGADHGLVPGKAIGVRDCSNPLVNYPALVVASIPTPRQITCIAGPGGNIVSQTITNPTGAKGFVFFRERMGRATNGVAQIFENANAAQASLYIRSESGDSLPSGTVGASHAVTVGSTASVQLINTPFAYAFTSTTEYRLGLESVRAGWADAPVDSQALASPRLVRTQVVPDTSHSYKFRIRANNSKSLTVLTAKVVSVSKSGSATGTFITETPHGLTTGDTVVYYGNSNTAANAFPNLIAALPVTVSDANTFLIATIGTTNTITGYGGVIAKVQGGNLLPGANNNSAINATLSTLTNGKRILVLTGAAAWSGLVNGDYVEVVGVSNVTNGATLGVDGAWKVASSVTTALTLEPATAAFAATLPADFALTNSAGAIVKRTCQRVSYVRITDTVRRGAGDLAASLPVALQGTSAISGTVTANAGTGNFNVIAAAGTAVIGYTAPVVPTLVADVASAAITTTATTAAITPTYGVSYQVNIPVTAVSGTNPTLDVVVQESDDNGTNWFDVWHFQRITATGMYRSPKLPYTGNRVRYAQTLSGTSPSFTRAINRVQLSDPTPSVRRIFDRTLNSAQALNATTAVLSALSGELGVQFIVNAGTITTTAPAFKLQGSEDAITWYDIPTGTLTAVASSAVQVTVPSINASFVRAIVTTAGVAATLNNVTLKAF
jgi:hypothetical protein